MYRPDPKEIDEYYSVLVILEKVKANLLCEVRTDINDTPMLIVLRWRAGGNVNLFDRLRCAD